MSDGSEVAAARLSDLKVRSISALVLVVMVFGALWGGGWAFAALLLLGAGLLNYEWWGLVRPLPASFASRVLWPLAGPVYIALGILGLLVCRQAGIAMTVWAFAVVWATDIGAYFAGRAIGGPKLAPRISPAKTWSGLLGGMLCALLCGAGLAYWQGLNPLLLWLGAPLAALAQAGDLLESFMKRRIGVKDSGKAIPGHGGLFDRVDGLLPVAIVLGGLLMARWI